MKYELRVDLLFIEEGTGELIPKVQRFFGSIPIDGDLQQHIEMAGRAAAVQAYFNMLRELARQKREGF